ncbi:hypothetical protein IWQ47_001952 [Aquimarina sp. EL_43]|uniref:hypothetical protein n=1 Tax=unclassified Aquimarina TaxID=2627091 RepID=UPI0018C8DF91|nr:MULTISPECIES: hypothetical protein [unclassified Aquimarina]MBG6129965.1 hypothetical protein [Aquimarina sp. EL_35]MBG6148745.1 hypothetical protein [Aquimarina sp. EL_32]MBG6168881.1 hypothetical protein [Aquimarina sp. EL_43]
MKIDKVKNYNQKLLAVLGTIGAIFLVVALIAFISILIQEYSRSNYHDPETGILSNEKIEKLQKENKREQVISYETPKLIDTLNSIYIIPVSHKTLNEKENINGLLNAFSYSDEFYEKPDSRYSGEFYGAFNNVIVYNPNNGKNNKLFDERVNFNDIKTEYFDKEILLLIKASEKDTYKDGVINLMDFKSLYVYSFSQKKMQKIGIDGMDVYNYKFINNSKDLIIRFGIDKNNDGLYEEYNEPTLIKNYDFESGQLTDIIDEKTSSDLQKTLEGTQK